MIRYHIDIITTYIKHILHHTLNYNYRHIIHYIYHIYYDNLFTLFDTLFLIYLCYPCEDTALLSLLLYIGFYSNSFIYPRLLVTCTTRLGKFMLPFINFVLFTYYTILLYLDYIT